MSSIIIYILKKCQVNLTGFANAHPDYNFYSTIIKNHKRCEAPAEHRKHRLLNVELNLNRVLAIRGVNIKKNNRQYRKLFIAEQDYDFSFSTISNFQTI